MAERGPHPTEFAALDAAIALSLRDLRDSREPPTLLFSGGVDSSLLAWELRRCRGLRLFTVGTASSSDLEAARSGASTLGLPWSSTVVGRSDVDDVVSRVEDLLGDLDPVARVVQTALGIALARSPEGPVVAGQGVDELFLGYAHFRGLEPRAAHDRAEADLRRLLERDWPTTERMAERLGRRVSAPYLDPEFLAAARAIPIELRLPAPVPKAFFRRWASHRGLPPTLVDRPKKALQYGSGIARVVRAG